MSDELRGDCGRCAGLCCLVPAFSASADFPVDKPAGTPCANLRSDFRCGVHDGLRGLGFVGCTAYDCFGAGQRLTAAFGGRSWRDDLATRAAMVAAFPVARDVHELAWYVAEAVRLAPDAASRRAAGEQQRRLRPLLDAPERSASIDVAAVRAEANSVLVRVSEALRSGFRGRRDLRGADLVGARLVGEDLSGANLRGCLLVGADLSGARLWTADVTGADLRGASVVGADLRAVFLTQSQVDSVMGDGETRLPERVVRPAHWS